MKTVVLIFSIILSLLGILVGQFAYPFMASLFDGMPILFAAIIGVLIVIVLSIIVSVATKEKFYRASIIAPCIISVVATFFILLARFYSDDYRNGYIYYNGELKNDIGVTIVDSSIGPYWFMGIDEYGNNVLVNIDYGKDYDYKSDDDEKYDYEIKWYDLSGNYLGSNEFTRYYDEDDEELHPNTWGRYYDDAKYIAENWADIELYKSIG